MSTTRPKGKRKVLEQSTLCLHSYLPVKPKGKTKVFWKGLFVVLMLMGSLHLQAQIYDTVVAVLEPPAKVKDSFDFELIAKSYVPVIDVRKVNDSTLRQLQQDEDFWYANKTPVQKKVKQPASSDALFNLLQAKWFKTFLWLLICGSFVAAIAWYLSSLNIRLFRRRSVAVAAFEEEKIPDDIFSIAYEKRIAEAVQNNNYRLAVRLLYLRALTRLSKKNLIEFKQDKTNSEYLQQLYNTVYYNEFFKLTRSFEYTWYGQFALSKNAFETVQKDFETFNHKLS